MAPQFQPTFTKAYLQRHRDTHARAPSFGTHEHPYLHDTMRGLAAEIKAAEGRAPSLLDYGCGKGNFLEAMRRLGIFDNLQGYDPAIPAVSAQPDGRFDIVTCLDILDQIEPRFVDAVIGNVAQLTLGRAVFDIVSKQAKGVTQKTEPAFVWMQRIQRRMAVVTTKLHAGEILEVSAGAFVERTIIIARPLT